MSCEWMKTLGHGTKVVVLDSAYERATPHVFPSEVRRFITDPFITDHATKVSQVIASQDPQQIGVAPGCELYVGEVVGNLTRGWYSLCDALDWAIALRADVVNMSFANVMSFQEADERLRTLDDIGCICVASYNAYLHWPHRLEQVLSVGLVNQTTECDVVARDSTPVTINGTVEWFRGTSAAAASVSGMAACYKSHKPHANRREFIAAIAAQQARGPVGG